MLKPHKTPNPNFGTDYLTCVAEGSDACVAAGGPPPPGAGCGGAAPPCPGSHPGSVGSHQTPPTPACVPLVSPGWSQNTH